MCIFVSFRSSAFIASLWINAMAGSSMFSKTQDIVVILPLHIPSVILVLSTPSPFPAPFLYFIVTLVHDTIILCWIFLMHVQLWLKSSELTSIRLVKCKWALNQGGPGWLGLNSGELFQIAVNSPLPPTKEKNKSVVFIVHLYDRCVQLLPTPPAQKGKTSYQPSIDPIHRLACTLAFCTHWKQFRLHVIGSSITTFSHGSYQFPTSYRMYCPLFLVAFIIKYYLGAFVVC